MKRDGKYRFSLQFGAETTEQVQAGELLERLGNRKSAIVVAALNEYITTHPEFAEPAGRKIHVKIEGGGISRDTLEQMIRTLIDERIKDGRLSADSAEITSVQPPNSLNEGIAAMISNLDLFTG